MKLTDFVVRDAILPTVKATSKEAVIREMVASLKAAGVRLVLPEGADPSLPLALGGVGINLRQLDRKSTRLNSSHGYPLSLHDALPICDSWPV